MVLRQRTDQPLAEIPARRNYSMGIEEEKQRIRQTLRGQIEAQTEKDRVNKSRQIAMKLKKIGDFTRAKTILFYYSADGEVMTHDLIAESINEGKQVLLPSVDKSSDMIRPVIVKDLKNDLAPGSYGIMEPKPEKQKAVSFDEIDVVIVPGLAFDHAKYRLGRGKGFYDRFLAKLPRKTTTIGLAYDFQILESLPVTELDVPVTRVVHN